MASVSAATPETPSNAATVALHDLQPAERARRMHSLALRTMDTRSAATIARDMGMSEATVSRVKNERLEDALLLLAHLGLTIVPVDACVVPAERWAAVVHFAREGLANLAVEGLTSWL